MAEDAPRISLLPDDIRAKVSSSFEITSPEAVVEGLLRNALDAEARSIAIDADFAKGYLAVSDNGTGIREVEFLEQGQLAKLHCSSKFNTLGSTYGRFGRFLSNLSHLCLLSIASQHRSSLSANRLVLHRGVVINRQTRMCQEEVGLVRQGTRVVVHNLFGDIPVRFKQLSMRYDSPSETERVFERVKVMLVGYLLACHQLVEMRFSLRGEKHQSLRCNVPRLNGAHFSLDSIMAVLFQAKLLGTLDSKQWRCASVRTTDFSIRAVISTIPAPSKTAQFISIGNFPLRRRDGSDSFFDPIDRLFEGSNFGSLDEEEMSPGNGVRLRESARAVTDTGRLGKGVDRWPMFYLRIETKSGQIPSLLGQAEPAANALPMVEHLMKALESLISHFLISSGFTPKAKVAKARKAGCRITHGCDLSDQSRSHSHSLELSRGATETRFLNHWHRVKSARPSPENFHYGLGFDKPKDSLESVVGSLDEASLLTDQLPQETQGEAADNDLPVIENGVDDSVICLPWTNPRNGQVVYLNPRTGASMPSSTSPRNFRLEGCCENPGAQQHIRRTEESRSSAEDRANHRSVASATKLDKYLHGISFQDTEAPVVAYGASSNASPQAPELGVNASLAAQSVTKSALSTAKVIQQVDQKFVLVTVNISDQRAFENSEKTLAVLIDQHAADERIKFEQLCEDVCNRSSTTLSTPLTFEVDAIEAKLLEDSKAYFRRWCLDYNLVEEPQYCSGPRKHGRWTLEVHTLPSLIAERCHAEPKLLINLIRREIWSSRPCRLPFTKHAVPQVEQAWWSEIVHCPEGMVEMLKSRSCRTAIMFNDVLTVEQCRDLVNQLSLCSFPFQCAHGRPTLTVLVDFNEIRGLTKTGSIDIPNDVVNLGYGDAWSDWIDLE